MDLGTLHGEPPGETCQAPQQLRRRQRHDRTEGLDSGQQEPKVGKSKWRCQPEIPAPGRPGKGVPEVSRK